jgi:spermidine synthase
VRGVRRIIYSGESKYQSIAIVEFDDVGKSLLLDGKVQSSVFDEFVYHESLVHPAMITHPNPRSVLILGGGEGATAREVLRYSSVEEVIMVDIDEEVIRVSRQYLPEMHQGAFDDERLRLVIGDGRRFLEESRETFDVVILDLTDPLEGGPSYLLYTVEFYGLVKRRLSPMGIMVTQATSTSYSLRTYATILRTVSEVFPVARPYHAYVHSFDSSWGFVIGSLGPDPLSLGIDELNRRLSNVKGVLRFYEPEMHRVLFTLPRYIREALSDPTLRPATDSNPTFMPA